VPDDVGGQPLPNGEEPEYLHHGAADDEFASVVFDEDFVRSAAVHEPTAVERILAAAQSHAESETVRGFEDGYVYGPGTEGEFDLEADDDLDGTAEDDPDDPDEEGRFDRSDYTEYLEQADEDVYDHNESYGPYNSYGDTGYYGHYDQYGQSDQYGQYIRFGVNRRHDPRFELGEEHGSDHRRRSHGKHAKHTRRSAVPISRLYRGHAGWYRPVAWLLAVVMGIGMVALALGAVYRGTSQQRQDPSPRPATTGVDDSPKREHDGAQGSLGVPAEPRSG
jgi:hypothetical protein